MLLEILGELYKEVAICQCTLWEWLGRTGDADRLLDPHSLYLRGGHASFGECLFEAPPRPAREPTQALMS